MIKNKGKKNCYKEQNPVLVLTEKNIRVTTSKYVKEKWCANSIKLVKTSAEKIITLKKTISGMENLSSGLNNTLDSAKKKKKKNL